MVPASDPMVRSKDVHVALDSSVHVRAARMERKDLLEGDGKIFGPQGQALDRVADRNGKYWSSAIRRTTNCLIA